MQGVRRRSYSTYEAEERNAAVRPQSQQQNLAATRLMKDSFRGSLCPCGSGQEFAACCGRFIVDNETAATAAALMRSRYTAYALGNEPYLLNTWHVSTRPTSLNLGEQPAPQWIGLKILRHEPLDDTHAIVEFVARYKVNGRAFRLQETSRFLKENGRWFYVDADSVPGAE
jgi:SEC-C motif-containing protein